MKRLGVLLVVALVSGSALAQVPTPIPNAVGGTTVDLHPIWTTFQPILETVVGAAVTALLSWMAIVFQRWTGHEIERKHMEALDSSIRTGLGQFLARVGTAPMTVDLKRAAVVNAMEWVARSTPDALAFFGLDTPEEREKLGDRVAGTLGQMLMAATPGVATLG